MKLTDKMIADAKKAGFFVETLGEDSCVTIQPIQYQGISNSRITEQLAKFAELRTKRYVKWIKILEDTLNNVDSYLRDSSNTSEHRDRRIKIKQILATKPAELKG